jgi:hypothetical protein
MAYRAAFRLAGNFALPGFCPLGQPGFSRSLLTKKAGSVENQLSFSNL